jgi:hypothetical protein
MLRPAVRPNMTFRVLLLCLPTLAPGVRAQTLALLDTAVLAAPRLREASGLAVSRTHPGIYWVHNDSGDQPLLYTTDSTGADLGRVRVAGATAVDWEDIALGPCVVAPGDCLYVGDTGDNRLRRRSVTIYRLHEPSPPRHALDTLRVVTLLDSIVVRYPDGPHDAEALAISPSGKLYLVTKPRSGEPHVFVIDAGRPATPIVDGGPLDVETNLVRGRMVTGGTITVDGRWMLLRTYVSLHAFRIGEDGRLTAAWPREGLPLPVVEAQGEGIDLDAQGRIVLISERGQSDHATLSRLTLTPPVAAGP